MQERKTYAKGGTLESTTGYVVKVGMPVVDDTVTANEFGNAEFTVLNYFADGLNPYTSGQFLATLEVNGEAIAYKETVTIEDGEVSIDEYDISIDEDDATVGVAAGDIVRLLIEPLEVSVSDGFRAAIKKAVPQSGGGSGGGSDVEVVRFDLQIVFGGEPTVECDHTVAEIDAARTAGKLIIGLFGEEPEQMAVVSYSGEEDYTYSAVFYSHEVASGTLTVVQTGFYYEEGAWVYAQSSIELTGTGS